IWNKAAKNHLTDARNDYDGRITIEVHGKSSLMFPKKSYRFETQNKYRENLNTRILGMPAEDDWILYAPYSDKTLMRNFLIYTLAGEINDYAPRVRFCELIVDNEYKGVYVMTEKIEEDADRVDVAELTPQDKTEPAITGGYVFRKDKIDPDDNLLSLSWSNVDLIINEPKADEINEAQENWLTDHLNEFDRELHTNGNYADYVDVESFVHNFLIVEFAKNIDGYRLSTYFHKDRGEKITAGPVWDYNLSLGNADYYNGWDPQGWYYPIPGAGSPMDDIFWFDEIIEDPDFYNYSIRRWKELRKDQFSLHHINSLIDHWTKKLEEAQARNFAKYQILGQYVWPNPGFPQSGSEGYNAPTSGGPVTWEGEVERLKDFIKARLEWMDEQFGLNSLKVRLNVANPPNGKIIHQQDIIHDSTCTEIFSGDSIIQLQAVPSQGYRFKHWVKSNVGNTMEGIVEKGSTWKYLDKGTEPSDGWSQIDFNDSGWEAGKAQLGYGDGDEETVVDYGSDGDNKYVTTYFRHTFSVEDTSKYKKLSIDLLRDDGAVVYLNGEEVIRSNMPGGEITYDTTASDYLSGQEESTFKTFTIDKDHLNPGENILAVEIHQANSTSSDISFDLGLSGILKDEDNAPVVIGEERSLTYTLEDDVSLIRANFEAYDQDTVSPVINEFLASNNNNVKDDFFENDDWIELYNPVNQAVDIGGLYISDDPSEPQKYQIPGNVPNKTTMDPKDHLILWADNDSMQGPLHLNFRLDKDSEAITLAKEENGQIRFLDVLSFQRQTSDVSKGRLPDGSLSWEFFNTPTPGEENKVTPIDFTNSTESKTSGYSLKANYPNPFRNATTIGYRIPGREHVKIAIYNELGRLVKVLVNQTQPAGMHKIQWHATDLEPGIYFYRMTCGNYSEVRKALIVR
ncbi:MAG: CotH kinase family protein, partial [Bacteroidales bacterium]|nr:CotH kinase family protein [Bacteroidales bacterium]